MQLPQMSDIHDEILALFLFTLTKASRMIEQKNRFPSRR